MVKAVQTDLEEFLREPPARDALSDKGRELPDPTPMAPPLGYKPRPSLAEQIRAMVRSEHLKQAAEAAGAESFEDADDFEVGEDYDPTSPYENDFDPPVKELLHAGTEVIKKRSSKPKPPAEGEGGEAAGSQKDPPAPPPDDKPEKT